MDNRRAIWSVFVISALLTVLIFLLALIFVRVQANVREMGTSGWQDRAIRLAKDINDGFSQKAAWHDEAINLANDINQGFLKGE